MTNRRAFMAKLEDGEDRATKRIRRVARIWSLVIIIYSLLMLTGYAWNWVTTGKADPYAVEGYPPSENLLPLAMGLSVAGLGIAWRWEALGGAINIGFFLVNLGLYWLLRGRFLPLGVVAILSLAIIPGILFLVCWWRSKSRNNLNST
jgi:hypothetical protein